jgi:hypothetical protein
VDYAAPLPEALVELYTCTPLLAFMEGVATGNSGLFLGDLIQIGETVPMILESERKKHDPVMYGTFGDGEDADENFRLSEWVFEAVEDHERWLDQKLELYSQEQFRGSHQYLLRVPGVERRAFGKNRQEMPPEPPPNTC